MIYSGAIIFDGRKLASEKEKFLKKKVKRLVTKYGFRPILVSILIGENPSSRKYLEIKKASAQRIGVDFEKKEFPENVDPQQVIAEIKCANQDDKVWGIMVQLPLPKQFPISNFQFPILNAIDPEKDADCLTDQNLELLKKGKPRFLPATTKAILSIFQAAKIGLVGKKIVVVGAKGFVGQPLVSYLQALGCNVVGVDKETRDLKTKTHQAEILISATGVPGLIRKEMVKPGAVVIDVGSPKGDVDFEEVKKVASFITPVPGGVGPLTVVSLFENLFEVKPSF